MSELIPQVAGLVSPVVSEEDPDHGVHLDDWVEVIMVSHRTKPFRLSSIKSLETPTTLARSLAGGSLGMRRYGNLIMTASQRHSHGQLVGRTMVVMRYDYIPQLNLMG